VHGVVEHAERLHVISECRVPVSRALLGCRHLVVDLDCIVVGDELHEAQDLTQRLARLVQEARDPSVGVIVLDFILGYGAHEDPAGVMIPALVEAKQIAATEGRHLEILGYVLGTDLDSQSLAEQTAKLSEVGVTIASSCTNAGLLARGFVSKEN